MFETPRKRQSISCPYCTSIRVQRSRTRGIGERLLHLLLFESPYRCQQCFKRFFRSRLFFTLEGKRHHGVRQEGSAHR